ncbi:MAG: hypothetical protein ABSB75_09150 [Candidatus Limnocylindrales bacterium]
MTTENPAPASATPNPGFSRFMARWLASPFGALSGRVVLIRYKGRVSGQPRQLPVNCEPFEDRFLIRVGLPEQKTWWRNFRTPWPMEMVRKGRRIPASAVAVMGDTAEGRRIAAEYFTRHSGAARRAGLPRMRKGEVASPEALEAAAAQLVFIVVTPERLRPVA